MTTSNAPQPIQAFITATNAGDSEAFVAVFTDDAFIDDWGRTFHGHTGVASWNHTDNIGKNAHFDLHHLRAGARDGEYIATVTVSGGGYNGPGEFTFQLSDGRISRFLIA